MSQTETLEKARFDGQLLKDQKNFFERAAQLAGFKNLTEFVFSAAQEKAETIVMNHETLLASQRDREVFFEALMNPPEPNEKLMSAAQKYKKKVENN